MRQRMLAAAVCMATACGRIGFDARGIDANGSDGPSTDDGQAIAPCADPNILACYEFEGDTLDGSAAALPTTSSNVMFGPGVRGQAVVVSNASRIDPLDSQPFSLSVFTFEGWFRADAFPVGLALADVIDVETNFSVQIESDQHLGAYGLSTTELVAGPVSLGVWTHVALVSDGTLSTLYVDGLRVAQQPIAEVPAFPTTVSLGGEAPGPGPENQFVGALDTLRLWSIPLDDAAVCAIAGC